MRKLLSKTPLIFRVVFLYLAVGFIVWLAYCSAALINTTAVNIIPQRNYKSMNATPVVEKVMIEDDPTWFNIDRLKIDFAIKQGYYDASTDSWTLSNGVVYFATVTRRPNNQDGSTFMYGHNQDDTIAKLTDLIVGDNLSITTQNGYIFEYKYSSDEYVAPSYVGILNYKPTTPRLIVSTCEGIFGQVRRLMYFDFIEVRKL